jgi:demethylmenaquinone methyltransferase/2-methoxy-6-polyprenyl-1,4-benzoquinol methylase
VRVTNGVLASQVEYYRRRAAEYEATSYGDVVAARARIARLIAQMQPIGAVLEIACGTGLWSEALADHAHTLTAIDVAPEAVAIARDRVRATNVRFEVADVFSWTTAGQFDVIFFSAWLSHVPTSRFDVFWQMLRELLAQGGRVLFVDEPVELRDRETYVPGSEEIVERQLRDGTTFRLVKNFIDPGQLEHRLHELGWRCRTWRDDDDWAWICGEAHPVTT